MESLSFYSLNCRGLNSTEKRTKLFTWFTDINADIILFKRHILLKNTKITTMLDGLGNTFIIFQIHNTAGEHPYYFENN